MDTGSHSVPNTVFTFKRHPARKLPWKSLPLEELLLCLQSLLVFCLFSDCAALHPALPAEAQADPQANATEQLISFPLDGGGPPTAEDLCSLMRGCDGERLLDFLHKKPFLPQGFLFFFSPFESLRKQIARSVGFRLGYGNTGEVNSVCFSLMK